MRRTGLTVHIPTRTEWSVHHTQPRLDLNSLLLAEAVLSKLALMGSRSAWTSQGSFWPVLGRYVCVPDNTWNEIGGGGTFCVPRKRRLRRR